MAQQYIDVGNVANDGTGDPLRTAFQLINSNFDDVYHPSNIANGSSRVDVARDGNIFITSNGIANVVNISSSAMTITGNLIVTGNATLSGNIIGDRVVNGTSELAIQTANGNANITIGNVSNVAVFTTTGLNIAGITSVSGNIIAANLNAVGLSLSGNVLSNIRSVSNITTTANITGGNLLATGLSLSGNVLSALNSTSNITTTANISSNSYIGTLVSATSIVTAGNLATSGTVSATGNVTGGNILTGGTVSAAGNILISGLISAAGNITASDITIGSGNTGNAVVYGNLIVYGNTTTINSNTVTTNDLNITVGNNQNTGAALNNAGLDVGNNALAYWRFNNSTTSWQSNVAVMPAANSTLSLGGVNNYWATAYINTALVEGNITGGNLLTSGLISATGNVTGGNLLTSGGISSSGSITAASIVGSVVSVTGNVIGGNLLTSGLISATGNVTGGNLLFGAGEVTGTGNVVGGNILTVGVVSATANITGGNIDTAGNVTGGNILTGGLISTAANVTGANIVTAGNVTGGNILTGGLISSTGNVTGGNLTTGGTVSAVGNITGGNIVGNIVGTTANVIGNITVGNANVGAYTTQALRVNGTGYVTSSAVADPYAAAGTFDVAGINSPNVTVRAYSQTTSPSSGPVLKFVRKQQTGTPLNAGLDAGRMQFWGIQPNNDVYNYIGEVLGNTTGSGTDGQLEFYSGLANVPQLVLTLDTSKQANFAGAISAVGNITAGNITVGRVNGNLFSTTASASGNITGGNILTAGNVSATGNIAGNYFIGNGSQLTGPLQSNPDGDGVAAAYSDLNPTINGVSIFGTWAFGADGNLYIGGLQSQVLNAYHPTAGNSFVNSAGGYYVGSMDTYAGAGPFSITQVIDGNGNITAPLLSVTGNITTSGNIVGVFRPTSGTGANGIVFPSDPGGGSGDGASIQYYASVGEATVLELAVTNDTNDIIQLNASGGVSVVGNITANVNGYSIGYLNIPQVSLTTDTSVALSDSGKHYYSTSGSTINLTVPNNSSVSWPVGTTITVINNGVGNIVVTQGSGVSMYLAGNSTASNRSLTSYGMATIINVGANVWFINGTGLT